MERATEETLITFTTVILHLDLLKEVDISIPSNVILLDLVTFSSLLMIPLLLTVLLSPLPKPFAVLDLEDGTAVTLQLHTMLQSLTLNIIFHTAAATQLISLTTSFIITLM